MANSLYGGMNIVNIGNRYVFDKIYETEADLINAATNDGVYLGRTVYVKSNRTGYIKIQNEKEELEYTPFIKTDCIYNEGILSTETDLPTSFTCFIATENLPIALSVEDSNFIPDEENNMCIVFQENDNNFLFSLKDHSIWKILTNDNKPIAKMREIIKDIIIDCN